MDRIFDRLMDSKWFLRGLALVLALLLYVTAFIDDNGTISGTNVNGNTRTETIENVPVVLYYDEENLVVSNAPTHVNVIVEGPSSFVQSAKNLRDFVVFLDLTDAKLGNQRVNFEVAEISDRLKVSVQPASAMVNVQEKVTKEFVVEAQYSKGMFEDGYTPEEPIIEPKTVKITGGKDIIDSIAYVKATVESDKKISETYNTRASVTVLDKNLNKLDVVVEPNRVNVTIPVVSPNKTLPVKVKQVGELKGGIYIKSMIPAVREVVVFGKKSVLNNLSEIELEVDVSDIKESKVIKVPVKLPEGLTGVSPETIDVEVTIDTEDTVNLEGIPIKITGLGRQFNLSFLNPQNGQVNVRVTGPSEVLKGLKASDIEALIQVSDLEEGQHNVEIIINGPQNIRLQPNIKSATIELANLDEG